MSPKVDKNITQVLAEFGLTEREVAIYLALIKNGPSSIVEVAKASGIKRTTAHNNVDELISKGLVSQIKVGGRRKVVAEDPEELFSLLENKRKKLSILETDLTGMVTSLKELADSSSSSATIWMKYYEGVGAISSLYDEILHSGRVYSITNLSRVSKHLPENQRKFQEAINSGKIDLWQVIQDPTWVEHEDDLEEQNYHVKKLSGDVKSIGFDLIIYTGKLLIVDFSGPQLTAIQINNKVIVDGLTFMFKLVWESS